MSDALSEHDKWTKTTNDWLAVLGALQLWLRQPMNDRKMAMVLGSNKRKLATLLEPYFDERKAMDERLKKRQEEEAAKRAAFEAEAEDGEEYESDFNYQHELSAELKPLLEAKLTGEPLDTIGAQQVDAMLKQKNVSVSGEAIAEIGFLVTEEREQPKKPKPRASRKGGK